MSLQDVFYFKLWQPFCSAEWNDFSTFGKGSSKKHFCEIILKSGHWSRKRGHFKVFSIFSSGGHFVQCNRTSFAILVEGYPKKHFCEIILKSVH